MKKLITTALIALSVAAVATAPSLAAKPDGPAKKATGDITFINKGYPADLGNVSAHWVFNAIERTSTSPVKGSTTYTDQFGSYTGDVISVSVDGANGDATFTAKVTSSTYLYANVGDMFTWTVHDRGEQGVGNDYFTYLPTGGGSLELDPVTAGNIQVHS